MKTFFSILVLLCCLQGIYAQRIGQVPDSVRKKYAADNALRNSKGAVLLDTAKLNQDSLIKIKLVELAYNNTNIVLADANIRIAEANLAYAKKSWLSSLNAGANINEFVVNSSPAANFFPKYNLGLSVPFDILSRLKREKRVATETLIINTELKKERLQLLKAEVLTRYENYKQKKELLFIQRSSLEYDYSGYLSAQRSFADGEIKIEDMNKAYQSYLGESVKVVTRESDLRIAIIELEQYIGIPFDEAVNLAFRR